MPLSTLASPDDDPDYEDPDDEDYEDEDEDDEEEDEPEEGTWQVHGAGARFA